MTDFDDTSKAARLVALFGGLTPLAAGIGVDIAVVSRWRSSGRRGKNGVVPPRYNAAILDAAKKAGITASKVKTCLEQNVCPCCRQRLKTPIDLSALPNDVRAFVVGAGAGG